MTTVEQAMAVFFNSSEYEKETGTLTRSFNTSPNSLINAKSVYVKPTCFSCINTSCSVSFDSDQQSTLSTKAIYLPLAYSIPVLRATAAPLFSAKVTNLIRLSSLANPSIISTELSWLQSLTKIISQLM